VKCQNCQKQQEYSICNNCWKYAFSKLEKLAQQYKELEYELLPSRGRVSERVSGSGESSPIPVRLETLHLRSGGISAPLMQHEAKMREIREETQITFRGDELNKITMTIEYISKRSDWARDNYLDADKLAITIISISHKVQSVLGHKSDDIHIGKCPTLGEDGKPCGASLKINPQALDKTLQIQCRACNTIWDSTHWLLLGKMLDA
jgi:hypothetical protein